MTAKRSADQGPSSGSAASESPATPAHVVIVGGGISGLAAAWYLIRADPTLNITVLESGATPGGKLSVSEVAGISVDEGAESFVASRPEALQLAREVGLETDVVAPDQFRAGIASRGRIRAMPRGQFMGIPTDLRALAASEVMSARGMFRVPLDRTFSATDMAEDISVGELVAARVGREVVDRMVDPLLGGVYAGRADDLSMAATMPALFREMRHERSLLTAARRIAESGMEAAGARRGIPFRGIVGGVGRVPGAMAAALVGSGVQIRTRTAARAVHRTATGWEIEVGTAGALQVLRADAVVVATPAHMAAELVAGVAPAAAMELAEIQAASVAVVTLALRSEHVTAPLQGSGVLVPQIEGRVVKAITFADQKWAWLGEAARASGVRLLRISLGRHGEPEVLERSDEELVALARLDLALLLGVRGVPIDVRVNRWTDALPQYAVGHRLRVERITLGLRETPTLALCGAAYEGVGVAACVGTAYEAAQRVARGLSEKALAGSAAGHV